jgi:hypothetical protein
MVVYTGGNKLLTVEVKEGTAMTTDEVYLLVAETRCAHGRLILDDAERAGHAWTVYLHDAAHPCTFRVPDYHAFQAHAPALPAAWMVLQTRAERAGHDYDADAGALTLPEIAQLLAAEQDATDVIWLIHAIHRVGPVTTGANVAYLIELADPATGEVRTVPSRAAYHQLRHDDAATPVA